MKIHQQDVDDLLSWSAELPGEQLRHEASHGTRATPYASTKEPEQTTMPSHPAPSQLNNLMSISAMPAYHGKCFEELRAEDYKVSLPHMGCFIQCTCPSSGATANVEGCRPDLLSYMQQIGVSLQHEHDNALAHGPCKLSN